MWNRRKVMGGIVGAGAAMAVKGETTENMAKSEFRDLNYGDNPPQAIQDNYDWDDIEKQKNAIDRALNGDFSEVDNKFYLNNKLDAYISDTHRLKSISDAGRELIHKERQLKHHRKDFLRSAKFKLDKLNNLLKMKPLDLLR